MDFSAKLDQLQAKTNEAVASAHAAAAENRDQLKQRVDKAENAAKQAMQDVKQQTDEAVDRAQSKWAQMKADAAARREDFKAKIEKGPSWTHLMPSTSRSTPSTTRNWPCWTHASTQMSRPRSPACSSWLGTRSTPLWKCAVWHTVDQCLVRRTRALTTTSVPLQPTTWKLSKGQPSLHELANIDRDLYTIVAVDSRRTQ